MMKATLGRTMGMNPITTNLEREPPAEEPKQTAHRPPCKIVLCFDGTGNQYEADGTETNILRIFHLLDRNAPDQCE